MVITRPSCCYGLNHIKVMKWFKPSCPKKPGGLRPCKPYTICDKPSFFCFKPYFFFDDLTHQQFGLNHNCPVPLCRQPAPARTGDSADLPAVVTETSDDAAPQPATVDSSDDGEDTVPRQRSNRRKQIAQETETIPKKANPKRKASRK